MRYGTEKLNARPGMFASLVDVVVKSLVRVQLCLVIKKLVSKDIYQQIQKEFSVYFRAMLSQNLKKTQRW